MKKVVAVLLVLAVMFSCLPLGMVSYAVMDEEKLASMPVVPETPLLKRFEVSSDAIIRCSEKSPWWASSAFDGKYGYIASMNNALEDNNFFESDRDKPWYVGADLNKNDSTPKFIRKIRYLPRFEFANRMNGAWFEGSYDGVTYTPICEPLSGHVSDRVNKDWDGPNGWFTIDIPDEINAYRYIRLRREEVIDVTEIEFYVAAGVDHIASLMAYQLGKEIRTPAAENKVVQTLPALDGEDAANYTVTYAVTAGNGTAVINGNQITYTPSQTEDLSVSIAVTAASKTDSSDTRTVTAPITVKRHAKGMIKVEPIPNADKPNEYSNVFANGYSKWDFNQNLAFDGKLGEIVGEGRNFYESRNDRDAFIGIDLGKSDTPRFVRKIRYMPRLGFADRLNNSVFEGSNVSNGEGYEAIAPVLSGHVKSDIDKTLNGGANGWFEIDLFDNIDSYRYLRLMRPLSVIQADKNQALNITEMEFYLAGGADHIASLVASRIGKVISRPADGNGVTEKTFAELTADTAGYVVTYTAAEGSEGVSIGADNKLTFTHSADTDLKATIAITATKDDDTRTILLPVTIKQNIDGTGMLAEDRDMIDEAFRAATTGESDTNRIVNGYIDLPIATKFGSAVTWEISGADAGEVTFEDNRLTSKDKNSESKTVTLTAAISLNGASDTLTYHVTVNSGLQIWYKFDSDSVNENAKTVKNSGVNTAIGAATLENGAEMLPGLGTVGAVYLNGGDRGTNSNYVKLPANIVSNIAGDYTISFMMYREGDNGWPFFIGNGAPGSNSWFGILPKQRDNAFYRFVPVKNNDDKIDIKLDSPNDKWLNVVLSYSGETMTMYVDGEAKGTANIPFKLSEKFGNQTEAAQNFLGKTGWNDPYYKGFLTDFRIYSRALSAEESSEIAGEKPDAVYADWQAVGQCKSAISLEKTEDIIKNITLPVPPEGNGSSITWTSSDTSVVSNTGVIKENAAGGETAILTATITKGSAVTTKTFAITLGKGGNEDALAKMDLDWLNGTAPVHYDFTANTTDAQDFIIMTLPKTAPKLSTIIWSYDGKGIGDEGSALTDKGDTVQLFVWKSAVEAINKQLTATVTNGAANKTFSKNVTAAQLDQIIIPASANAHSGTAKIEEKAGAVHKCLLTTQNGKIYFKFDIGSLNNNLQTLGKKVVKAELQIHNYMGTNASPIIVSEVAGGWNHGDHFGEINSDKTPIPAEQQIASPAEIELAYVGDDSPIRGTGLHDITYAFLNNLDTAATEYCLSLTNNSRFGETWPNGNSSAVSIEKDDPEHWTRLVLTLADDAAEMPAAYKEITKQTYSDAIAAFEGKKLAVGAPTQLPTASITVPNPDYVAPTAETGDGEGDGETPTIPETITLTGKWLASNATVDGNNRMKITDSAKDLFIGLHLDGYVKCFALGHEDFVESQYTQENVTNGIKLTRADNAGEGFLYTAVYEGTKLVSAERTDLSKAEWSDRTYTHTAPSVTAGQTVKYYLWNEQLAPYL